MRKSILILICLSLGSILIGCAGSQPVIKTETIKMYPPAGLVLPSIEPDIPELKDDATTGELLDWAYLRGEIYRQAWQESEADKAGIRKWMGP